MDRVFQYGMVGGSEGSFIGGVHRRAIGLAGGAELVCGCFDVDQENNLKSGLKYGVQGERIYRDYLEMASAESARPDKVDFVVIVTPNHLHFPVAKAFLENGFHVMCEKPLCFELEEAEELIKLVDKNRTLFGISYTYVGYPMVKQAKQLVRGGAIGEVVEVIAEYAQGWLAELCLRENGSITTWRNDPSVMGKSGCVGDIGTHIDAAVSYMTGLKTKSICANLRTVGAGVNLDSIGEILVKYDNGASGMYWCSQMAHGHSNGLIIRIFGTKGSVEWEQENPCSLRLSMAGQPAVTLIQGKEYLDPAVRRFCRLPAGHPEGLHEAFANLYVAYMQALSLLAEGKTKGCDELEFIDIHEGINRMKFIDMCVRSSQVDDKWIASNP